MTSYVEFESLWRKTKPRRRITEGFKKCRKCGAVLAATSDNFGKSADGQLGLDSYCRPCRKKQRSIYRRKLGISEWSSKH